MSLRLGPLLVALLTVCGCRDVQSRSPARARAVSQAPAPVRPPPSRWFRELSEMVRYGESFQLPPALQAALVLSPLPVPSAAPSTKASEAPASVPTDFQWPTACAVAGRVVVTAVRDREERDAGYVVWDLARSRRRTLRADRRDLVDAVHRIREIALVDGGQTLVTLTSTPHHGGGKTNCAVAVTFRDVGTGRALRRIVLEGTSWFEDEDALDYGERVSFVISPTGRHVAAIETPAPFPERARGWWPSERRVIVWETEHGTRTAELDTEGAPGEDVAFSLDESRVAVATIERVLVYPLDGGPRMAIPTAASVTPAHLHFNGPETLDRWYTTRWSRVWSEISIARSVEEKRVERSGDDELAAAGWGLALTRSGTLWERGGREHPRVVNQGVTCIPTDGRYFVRVSESAVQLLRGDGTVFTVPWKPRERTDENALDNFFAGALP